MPDDAITVPGLSKQLAMHQLLVAARATTLHGALLTAIGDLEPDIIADEMQKYAPEDGRKILQRAGIRDEHVFATPVVLAARPTLLGYYRLLLGSSQKIFYTSATGLSAFRAIEMSNRLTEASKRRLPNLCKAMNKAMGQLVTQLAPEMTREDVSQLPLLTLGTQFDGSYRNSIGTKATEEVFLAITDLLAPHLTSKTSTRASLTNSSGRKVTVALAADPDVAIHEHSGNRARLNIAIEIKGGSDKSNAHNRAGEAEKSHRKVASEAREFWTIIATKGVDAKVLRTESPTTREWFDIGEVLARSGPSWDRFVDLLARGIGVAIEDCSSSRPT